jgi:hypothetical protein
MGSCYFKDFATRHRYGENWLADDAIPCAFVVCPVAIATFLTNAHRMIMFSGKIPLRMAFSEKHYASLGRSKQNLFHRKKNII